MKTAGCNVECNLKSPTILAVDDDESLLDLVELYLERDGYKIIRAKDGQSAITAFKEHKPDLILLDLMLPDTNGLELCRRFRAQNGLPVPIIMLTSKSEEEDKLAGLEGGADDYITKPFSPRELVARVKVALRRMQQLKNINPKPLKQKDEILTLQGLYINRIARTVEKNGSLVELTSKEFDLLWFMASRPGQAFTREQLMEGVWHYSYFGEMSTVTVHIRRLREKIEQDPIHPTYIKTVWGVGYRFDL